MLKFFKVVHVIGVAMFLGSIFAHIAAGMVPGATSDPQVMLLCRQVIDFATRYVTLPGLAIAIVSGAIMMATAYRGLFKRRWLILHLTAALIVAAISVTVMVPAGRAILAAAGAVTRGEGSLQAFAAAALREHLFGAVNIILAIAAIVIAVAKPRLSQRQS